MEKSRTGQGIAWGLGLFVLLAVLAYGTPLRAPLLRAAGESHPALQYRLEAQRRALDSLQTLASNGPLAPAAQNRLNETRRALAGSQEQLERWEQGHARMSLGGLIAWGLDLFPWLLAFGLAFPILGGLIGAQFAPRPVPRPAKRAEPRDFENPPSVPVTPSRPAPQGERSAPVPPPRPSAPAQGTSPAAPPSIPSPDFDRIGKPAFKEPFGDDPASLSRHPALEASRRPAPATPPVAPPAAPAPFSEAPTPPATEEWGFRHQPRPIEGRPRPKSPPVRSPHASHGLGDDAPPAGH